MRDVDEFPGHIACDGDSKSEIVVPIMKGSQVSAFFFFTWQLVADTKDLRNGTT